MIYSTLEPAKPEVAAVVNEIGDAIQAVGTDQFQTCVSQIILETLNIREFMSFRRVDANAAPDVILAQSRDGRSSERVEAYRRCFFRLDPVNRLFSDNQPAGTYVARIRRDEIRNADYLNSCFVRPGISEKLTLAHRANGVWIALTLYEFEDDPVFDAQRLDTLYHVANLLLPLLSLHYRIVDLTPQTARISTAEMEERVRWAFPQLSRREVSVCARSIVGFTTEGIALDLGIKSTSVLTYRRRAYARLNVTSINQLSTMLIRSSAANHLALAG